VIVVDTNVLAYLYLPGKFSDAAEALLLRDAEWAVPRLWRSEFRNVLASYMRKGLLAYDDALSIHRKAEAVVAGAEYDVGAAQVLRLARDSGCSAHDCEFVALAEHLDVRLVSEDARLCDAFPNRAVLLSGA
jgi:predicted nucleic acid-binding protein